MASTSSKIIAGLIGAGALIGAYFAFFKKKDIPVVVKPGQCPAGQTYDPEIQTCVTPGPPPPVDPEHDLFVKSVTEAKNLIADSALSDLNKISLNKAIDVFQAAAKENVFIDEKKIIKAASRIPATKYQASLSHWIIAFANNTYPVINTKRMFVLGAAIQDPSPANIKNVTDIYNGITPASLPTTLDDGTIDKGIAFTGPRRPDVDNFYQFMN